MEDENISELIMKIYLNEDFNTRYIQIKQTACFLSQHGLQKDFNFFWKEKNLNNINID